MLCDQLHGGGGGAGRNVDAAAEQRQPAYEDQRQLKGSFWSKELSQRPPHWATETTNHPTGSAQTRWRDLHSPCVQPISQQLHSTACLRQATGACGTQISPCTMGPDAACMFSGQPWSHPTTDASTHTLHRGWRGGDSQSLGRHHTATYSARSRAEGCFSLVFKPREEHTLKC